MNTKVKKVKATPTYGGARIAVGLRLPVVLVETFELAAKDQVFGVGTTFDDVCEHLCRDFLLREWLRRTREVPHLIDTESGPIPAPRKPAAKKAAKKARKK